MVNFAELKEAVSLEQAVQALGLSLNAHGQQLRGKCPACESANDRALVVTPGRGFYCFTAKKGGDVIALAAHVLKLGVKEAAAELQKRAGNSSAGNSTSARNRTSSSPPETASEPPAEFPALTYLETAHESLQKLGIDPETAAHFECGYAPRGTLRGTLAIPIHDLSGMRIGYVGRALTDKPPMLTFPRNVSPHLLFNAHRQVENDEVFFTEDPLQVLLAYQNAGIENVIASLTDWTPETLSVLLHFMDFKEIIQLRPM